MEGIFAAKIYLRDFGQMASVDYPPWLGEQLNSGLRG